MFSTPLIDSSNDGATDLRTVSALAPGYTAVTRTDGGRYPGTVVKVISRAQEYLV